ncbi:MAG: glycosyltransferase [Chloroflexota bacterium]
MDHTPILPPSVLPGPNPACEVAVLIPCLNEAPSIAQVVTDFKRELPGATIYVYDNNSTDDTAALARAAGAVVRSEIIPGKSAVLRSMFRQIDADVYLMVDGDGTYPADRARALIAPILAGEADMVVGARLHPDAKAQISEANRLGNRFFRWLARRLFHVKLTDLLSGYRAFNRPFAIGMPITTNGFALETELTLKGLERGFRVVEVPADYRARPEGSHSKINRTRDGKLIFLTIFNLLRDYKPMTLFGGFAIIMWVVAIIPTMIAIDYWKQYGDLPRIPAAVLATGLFMVGIHLAIAGLVLHAISHRFQELDAIDTLGSPIRRSNHLPLTCKVPWPR